jgi:hypothetical protein
LQNRISHQKEKSAFPRWNPIFHFDSTAKNSIFSKSLSSRRELIEGSDFFNLSKLESRTLNTSGQALPNQKSDLDSKRNPMKANQKSDLDSKGNPILLTKNRIKNPKKIR